MTPAPSSAGFIVLSCTVDGSMVQKLMAAGNCVDARAEGMRTARIGACTSSPKMHAAAVSISFALVRLNRNRNLPSWPAL